MKMILIKILILFALILVVVPCAVQAKIISISASTQVLALDGNDTVWAWGDNSFGQLGVGTIGGNYGAPQKVLINNVTQIATGSSDSFALKSDGTVWAWGYGEDGRLGYGGMESQSKPVRVKNLTDAVAIVAGSEDCFALKSDGTVWAWGDNRNGETGDGTTNGDGTTGVSQQFRFTPVQVKGLTDVKMLGEGGCYAIKNDGTVYTWGRGKIRYTNESDINTTSGSGLMPSVVKGLDNVQQITNGGDYTLYVKDDGTVWGWGDCYYGELGDGTISNTIFSDNMSPMQAKITGVKIVSSMNDHLVALKNDGTVWNWGKYINIKGMNDNSGLPDPSNRGEPTPTLVNGLNNAVDVSAGFDFDIALKDDGSVWGWGRNDNNALGNGKNNVEVSPVLLFSSETQQASTPTATVTVAATESPTPVTASQDTVVPTQNSVSSTPASTPGFTFGNIAIIVCILLGIGLLSGFRLQKN